MQVKSIENGAYFSGRRFIDKQAYTNLADLLGKMNEKTAYVEDEFFYKSSFIKKLKIGDAFLVDTRGFIRQMPKDQQMHKETIFNTGKAQIIIKNKDGEVIGLDKPWYSSWNKIFKTFDEYLKSMLINFDNNAVVKQVRMNVSGLTDKGSQKQKELDSMLNKFFK